MAPSKNDKDFQIRFEIAAGLGIFLALIVSRFYIKISKNNKDSDFF